MWVIKKLCLDVIMTKVLKLEDYYRLMNIVDSGDDIDKLAEEYSYLDIAIEIRSMIEDGYVAKEGKNLVVTEKGKAQREHIAKAIQMTHKGWIFPKNDEKISPISENDIYLPSNIELLV